MVGGTNTFLFHRMFIVIRILNRCVAYRSGRLNPTISAFSHPKSRFREANTVAVRLIVKTTFTQAKADNLRFETRKPPMTVPRAAITMLRKPGRKLCNVFMDVSMIICMFSTIPIEMTLTVLTVFVFRYLTSVFTQRGFDVGF